MKNEDFISVDMLRELLRLDADTGLLFWKAREPHHFVSTERRSARATCGNWNARHAGKEAFFTVDAFGYKRGVVGNRQLSAARVVFAIHHGHWPKLHIDHINGIKTDNRPRNLRDVSRHVNMRNRAISVNSSTGVHGVSFYAGKYDAYITDGGKKLNLGRFPTIEQAIHARKAAEVKLGYHPNHGRRDCK